MGYEKTEFTPSSEYERSLEHAFNTIFNGAESRLRNDGGLSHQRNWRNGQYVFSAADYHPRTIVHGLAIALGFETTVPAYGNRTNVHLIRVKPTDEGLLEMRHYNYKDHRLQVSTNVITHEQMRALTSLEEQDKLTENLFKEFDQLVHTPSLLEYSDFLADVSSFSEAEKII